MLENKEVHLFDIKPIMSEIEKVIENGLNKLLGNYIERHELLEKTHQQLIQLPSIVEELNKRKAIIQVERNFNDSDSKCDNLKYTGSDFTSIRDMTENIVREQISSLENKLDKMGKMYDSIIPILDKLIDKNHHLNNDIKGEQNNNNNEHKVIEDLIYKDTIEYSSVSKSCENENIKIQIDECNKAEENENSNEVNPQLIICSPISPKEEVTSTSIDKEVNLDNSKEESAEYEETNDMLNPDTQIPEHVDEQEEVNEEDVGEEDVDEEEVGEEDVDEEEVDEEEVNEEDVGEEDVDEEEVGEEDVDEEDVDEEDVGEKDVGEEDVGEKDVDEEDVDEEDVDEEDVDEEVDEGEHVKHQSNSVESTESKTFNQESYDNEEASVETETKEFEEDEEDEEDEEIFEIDIDDKTYCTNNDENGFIWELTNDGEQGDKVGYFKESEPFFYAEEN